MKPPTNTRASTTALQKLFQYLEQKYGGLTKHMDTGSRAEIIKRNKFIHPQDLERLFTHEAAALHISQFYHPNDATWLGSKLAKEAESGHANNWQISTSRGLESSDVMTLGEHLPFNVATSMKDTDGYFYNVTRELQSRRVRSYDDNSTIEFSDTNSKEDDGESYTYQTYHQLWPLDKLRLELDESWSCGAGLAREENGSKRPFGGGLPRVMIGPTRWLKGFIHVDEMAPLSTTNGLFTANIYLQLPPSSLSSSSLDKDGNEKGNEDVHLYIWPLGIRSKWDWYTNAITLSGMSAQDAEMQIRLWKELGEPKRLSVKPGDLVLFCAQRPHAALGFKKGTRVSLQCFVQYDGLDKRLLIDC